MKKNIVLFILFVFYSSLLFSQKISDTTKILAVTKDETVYVGSELNKEGFKSGEDLTLSPKTVVLIIGAKSFVIGKGNFDYYEIAYKGKTYFIYEEDVTLLNKDLSFEKILTSEINSKELFRKNSIRLSYELTIGQQLNVLKKIESLRSKGLVVLQNSIYDESEYTEGTSFDFKIINLSNKTIKYINFNIIGFNSVEDKVFERGSAIKSVKGIGPIKKDESAVFEFKYVWFTDLVETFKVVSIKIQYMDGSVKIIDNPKSVTLTKSEYEKYLENE